MLACMYSMSPFWSVCFNFSMFRFTHSHWKSFVVVLIWCASSLCHETIMLMSNPDCCCYKHNLFPMYLQIRASICFFIPRWRQTTHVGGPLLAKEADSIRWRRKRFQPFLKREEQNKDVTRIQEQIWSFKEKKKKRGHHSLKPQWGTKRRQQQVWSVWNKRSGTGSDY